MFLREWKITDVEAFQYHLSPREVGHHSSYVGPFSYSELASNLQGPQHWDKSQNMQVQHKNAGSAVWGNGRTSVKVLSVTGRLIEGMSQDMPAGEWKKEKWERKGMDSLGWIDELKKLKILSSLDLEGTLTPGNHKVLRCSQEYGLLEWITHECKRPIVSFDWFQDRLCYYLCLKIMIGIVLFLVKLVYKFAFILWHKGFYSNKLLKIFIVHCMKYNIGIKWVVLEDPDVFFRIEKVMWVES